MAYAYAKACGVLGKSFVGARVGRLAAPGRIAELDRLIFPEAPLDLPEKELARRLQRRIGERSVDRIVRVIGALGRPSAVLARLARAYEYADLKAALQSLALGRAEAPAVHELRGLATVRWSAWPDLGAMTAGSEFAFLSGVPTEAGLSVLEARLDRLFYAELWRESAADAPLRALVAEEIALKNVLWVLRFKRFYPEELARLDDRLIEFGDAVSGRKSPFSRAARACVAWPLDDPAPWQAWPYKRLLDPPGPAWRLEPRRFQNRVARRLAASARTEFRRRPFTVGALAAFVRTIQAEEELLVSLTEGLALGFTAKETLDLLEASA
jgi:hypothetical protein